MSKKELKQQNKDLEIHLVDVISKFDPSDTGKFTKFLIDSMRTLKSERKRSLRKPRRKLNTPGTYETPSAAELSIVENILIHHFEELYGRDNLDSLYSFHNHLENNRIDEGHRDINQYTNWEDIKKQVSLATIKYEQKRLEKEVIKVLENDEWLVIRPLTLESSLTYGAATKWCTAMRTNYEYFYRYCDCGVLTYVIDKKNGDKYGVYYDSYGRISSRDEFSIWNVLDKRIDSVESTIPSDIIKQIYEMSKNEEPNKTYFSESEKIKGYGGNSVQLKSTLTLIEDPYEESEAMAPEPSMQVYGLEQPMSDSPMFTIQEESLEEVCDEMGEDSCEEISGAYEMEVPHNFIGYHHTTNERRA